MIGDITSAAVASVAEQIRPYIRYTLVITVDRACSSVPSISSSRSRRR
jgi:hypothetical protein